MNAELINILRSLQEAYERIGETYRARAYGRAISEIGKLNYTITLNTLSRRIIGVGPNIMQTIEDYLNGVPNSKLEKARAAAELSGIAGVGPATIKDWRSKGINSLSELRRAVAESKVKLTHMQQYGLRYYSDLNTRIPREEVTAISETLRQRVHAIDPAAIFTVAGSYRRGTASSGDIDVLISARPDSIAKLEEVLQYDTSYIDKLSTGRERFTFLYRGPINGLVRQVDILNLPRDSYYAGLLYFTGSWEFNESMRAHAKRLGYRLNQNGLFRQHGSELRRIPVSSEKDIFDILGMPYVAPTLR